MEISIAKVQAAVPKIDLRYPDGSVKPLALYGPAAAVFIAAYKKAMGSDKITKEEIAAAERDPKLQEAIIAKCSLNEPLAIQAVDALLTRDHRDLVGTLSLSAYMTIFFEAYRIVQEEVERGLEEFVLSKKA